MMSIKREGGVVDSPAFNTSPLSADWPELAHRDLIRRILISPTFARSERLSALLSYVCEMTLKGRESEINEQKIGHAVFGRSPNYDSAIDGIVRTQASRLRQRLELYFQQEGIAEPVRIVIPRGGYVPIFEPRPAATPALPAAGLHGSSTDVSVPAPGVVVAARTQFLRKLLPWVLCAAFAAIAILFWVRDHRLRPPVQASIPHPLWSHLFSTDHRTLVVAADSGLVMFHNMSGQRLGLDEYLQGEYRAQPPNPAIQGPGTPVRVWQTKLANARYTSIVDLEIILSLERKAKAPQGSVEVRYARDVRPNDLKSENVVLLGASEANPWVELFERKMNFVFHNDYSTNVFSVINKSPRHGEPAQWDSARNDPQHRVYGVVAYVPNLAGDGDALILEGTSMSGTEGAGDFVLDDSQLLPFLKQIQRPDGTIPHFELVVGTQNISSSAARNSLLAWRTMN